MKTYKTILVLRMIFEFIEHFDPEARHLITQHDYFMKSLGQKFDYTIVSTEVVSSANWFFFFFSHIWKLLIVNMVNI